MTSFALLCHVGRKERRKEDQLMKKQESQRHTAELMGRVHHHENTMKINKQQRKHMSHTARFSRNPVTQPTHFFFFRLGSQGRNGVMALAKIMRSGKLYTYIHIPHIPQITKGMLSVAIVHVHFIYFERDLWTALLGYKVIKGDILYHQV